MAKKDAVKSEHHTKILTLEIAAVAAIIIAAFGIGFSYHLLYNTFTLKSELNQSLHNSSILSSQIQSMRPEVNNYLSLNSSYNKLLNKTKTPEIINLATNQTVTVSNYSLSIPFYNGEYALYNNYTISGDYFINFTAPTDGYLLLYFYTSTAPTGTLGFASGSNTSRTFYFTKTPTTPTRYLLPCNYYSNCQEPATIPAVAGYEEVPNASDSLYVLPVLRGNAYFEIQNSNPKPITVKFSLRYVGENFANIPLDANYT